MSSKTRVALLRGINVGRNKRVAMADLRTLLGSMGYEDVKTHGQSGNALLATSSRSASATIERDIGARIEQDLGLDVQVMVRTVDELEAVMAANPFPGQGVAAKELHVAFLARALPGPKREEVEGLDRNEYRPDQYELGDGVIYLRLPNGVIASRLPDWERLLGLGVTVRNWNTVSRLAELARG